MNKSMRNCAIGLVTIVVGTSCTNAAWADELPGRLQDQVRRRLAEQGLPSAASPFDTEVKITASGGATEDQFGLSVSISGDTAIVGAFLDDDNGTDSGSAYVYGRHVGGTNNWGEVTKIQPSDALAHDLFGWSVSISGDTAVVGAIFANRLGSSWGGLAYVYGRDVGGLNNWGQVAKVTASDEALGDLFGSSVSISGDTAIVSASGDDDGGSGSGSAYIYGRDVGGLDNWGEVTKITASDAAAEDQFGQSVSISGDTAIVGANADDDGASLSGSAYVFGRDIGGIDNWGEITKITNSDPAAQEFFGASASISGDTAIVGAAGDANNGIRTGSAFVYGRNAGGLENWGLVTKIAASDATFGDRFGFSVSISGDVAIVGALNNDDNGPSSGSAYVFGRDVGGIDNWGEVTKITASDAAAEDLFGASVSISGDTAVVGAIFDDDNGTDSGSAYVYFGACNDNDGDGYGSPGAASCANGDADDCNDADNMIFPGASDICNGIDDDCDDAVDEDCGACCNFDGTCTEDVLPSECDGSAQIHLAGVSCEDAGACAAIPTVSEWGLIVMTLVLGCAIGTLTYRSRVAR